MAVKICSDCSSSRRVVCQRRALRSTAGHAVGVGPESALELMRQGDSSGAMKQLAKLRMSTDARYVAELTGVFLLDRGDVAGALTVYREAISRTPADESQLSYGLAIAEIGSRDLSGAEHALKTCEQNGGDS